MALTSIPGVALIVLQILSLGCSGAIVGIVADHLWLSWGGLTWGNWFVWSEGGYGHVCLMGDSSVNLCAYSFAVVAVSMVASLAILIIGCCTGKRVCRCVLYILCVLLLIWWIGAAITSTVYGVDADNRNLPQQGWRTSVWILAWVQVGLFLLTMLAGCLAGMRGSGGKEEKKAGKHTGGYPTGTYAPGQVPPAGPSYGALPLPPRV